MMSPEPSRKWSTAPAGNSPVHWNARSSDFGCEHAARARAAAATMTKRFFTCSSRRRGPTRSPVKYARGAGRLRAARACLLSVSELDASVDRFKADARPARLPDMRPQMLWVEAAADGHLEVGVQRAVERLEINVGAKI